MRPAPATRAHELAPRRARSRLRRPAGLLVALVATGLAGACDLRLETPPPPTPSPDAVERVRDAAARDAAEIAALAADAAEREPLELAGALVQAAEASAAHAAALGGVYDPFPDATAAPGPAGEPTATPTPEPPPPDAAAVLARLELAAERAAADADAAEDGELARLLGSVAVSRLLLAEGLARASGGTPAVTELTVPAGLPAGVDVADAVVLVASEDAAGMVWEVVAARSAEPDRTTAAQRARVHRERAQAWAEAAGIAGGAEDPRRSAYDLPAELTTAAATQEAVAVVAAGIEAELAVSYATLVADAAPGARGDLLDAVAEHTRLAVAAGGTVPAFPGLPERA